jgi:uncharacterized membrane protein YeaQ/YmgE (transglycosylase-associated protein family)
MRVIFGIIFAVIFGFLGAFFAGPLGDWLISLPKFSSPDQVAYFDYVVRIGVTVAIGLVGAVVGVLVAGRFRGRLIRKES